MAYSSQHITSNKQLISCLLLSSLITHTLSQNYIFNAAVLEMSDADALCSFCYGTNLVSIHSSSQNDEAKSLCTDECWIGANDIVTESIWVWTDGTPFDYGNDISGGIYPWDNNGGQEPNNANNEDCAHLDGTAKNWNDEHCDDNFATLCNYPTYITIVNDNINNIRQPIEDTIIGYMDVLDEIHIEFDFYMYSYVAEYWANILQIGTTGTKRYPAFFINGPNKLFHFSMSRITNFNTKFDYGNVTLNTWHHIETHITQTSHIIYYNNAQVLNENTIDSHQILFNQPIYISNKAEWNTALDGIIRDLKISTNNAYITPYNYLCDYTNRFTSIKGDWIIDTNNCWLLQNDTIGEGNVAWLGDIDSTSLLWSNYKIEFTVNIPNGTIDKFQAGIIFRATNVSTINNGGQHYYVDIRANTGIRFVRMDNGFNTLEEYETVRNISMNEDYIIRIEAESNNFKIYLENKLIITRSHSAYSAGSIGFRTYQAAAIYKNLRIIFQDNNNWISLDPTPAPTDMPTPAPTINPTKNPTPA
eukprot:391673_1